MYTTTFNQTLAAGAIGGGSVYLNGNTFVSGSAILSSSSDASLYGSFSTSNGASGYGYVNFTNRYSTSTTYIGYIRVFYLC